MSERVRENEREERKAINEGKENQQIQALTWHSLKSLSRNSVKGSLQAPGGAMHNHGG